MVLVEGRYWLQAPEDFAGEGLVGKTALLAVTAPNEYVSVAIQVGEVKGMPHSNAICTAACVCSHSQSLSSCCVCITTKDKSLQSC